MGSNDYAHRQLTRVVAGAVDDAFKNHPDYLTPKGKRSAKGSIVKRVAGTVLSFAVQAARGRLTTAVQEQAPRQEHVPVASVHNGVTGAGASLSPAPHCRIVRVRWKRMRDEQGRFVSVKDRRTAYYREQYGNLPDDVVAAAKSRASTKQKVG